MFRWPIDNRANIQPKRPILHREPTKVGSQIERKARPRLISILVILSAIGILYYKTSYPIVDVDSLIHRSRFAAVVAVSHLVEEPEPDDVVDCSLSWIDDYTGMFVRPSGSIWKPDKGHLVDIRSHHYRSAALVSRRDYTMPYYDRDGPDGIPLQQCFAAGKFQPSPDGKYVIVSGITRFPKSGISPPAFQVGVFALKDPQSIVWEPPSDVENFCWCRKGHSWIGLTTVAPGRIHCRTYQIARSSLRVTEKLAPPELPKGRDIDLASVSANGIATAVVADVGDTLSGLTLYQFDTKIDAAPRAARCFHVSAPLTECSGRAYEYKVSPDGTRIAWLLNRRVGMWNLALLQNLMAKLDRKPHLEQSLWITNLDGSNPRSLGDIHVDSNGEVYNLDWLPSGKSISYGYRHAVYTIPIDGSRANTD